MILCTLDIKQMKTQVLIYIIENLFCILFAIIYESFSHGVFSKFMILAFLIPLILGVIVTYILCFFKREKLPTALENKLYNAGVVTLTVGSIMEGVLQIYGTTNVKIFLYLIFGILLLTISILFYIFRNEK